MHCWEKNLKKENRDINKSQFYLKHQLKAVNSVVDQAIS